MRLRIVSGNVRPVDSLVEKTVHLFVENPMAGECEFGVFVENRVDVISGYLRDLPIGGKGGYFEIEGDAALHSSLDVAGTAHLEVGFGNFEAIGG